MRNLHDWTVNYDKTVQVSDAVLRYGVIGEGEPIICVHGTTIADAIITPLQLYPELFEEYQFIGYYRAGYNGSTVEKESISIKEGAHHIKELLDHLNIKKVHLIAFSFGGVIGFQFMLDYPEYLLSSVLLEPYLNREGEEAIRVNNEVAMKTYGLFQQGKKLKAGINFVEGICGPNILSAVDMTCPLDVWDRLEVAVEATVNLDFPAITGWPFKMSEALETMTDDQKPQTPILTIMGNDSEAIVPGFRETQQFLMKFFPQAARVGIPGATHGLQLMQPLLVGKAIYDFLKSVK